LLINHHQFGLEESSLERNHHQEQIIPTALPLKGVDRTEHAVGHPFALRIFLQATPHDRC
jgi:hypothetical protein